MIQEKNIMENVATVANIFAAGVTDVLSLHKTLPILVNNKEIFNETMRILASNMGLLLGSVFMLKYLINPGIVHIKSTFGDVPTSSDGSNGDTPESEIISLFYHSLWVIPIYALLYMASLAWYQNIASMAYKHANGVVKFPSLKTALTQTIYAMMVWVIVYAEVQLLLSVVPVVLHVVIEYLERSIGISTGITVSQFLTGKVIGSGDLSSSQLLGYVAIIIPLQLLSLFSYLVGCIGSSMLYGWYGFDYYWIMVGMEADTRFSLLEKHFYYFVGFGVPITLVMQTTEFFVGYGLYLALFPFLLILCAATDFKKSCAVHTDHMKGNEKQISVPVFQVPKQLAMSALRLIDKFIRVKKE